MTAAKRCRHCGELKPLELFPRQAKMRDGLSSWCKACHRERTRQWRAEHREELNARRREQDAEKRAEAQAAASAAIRDRLRADRLRQRRRGYQPA